MCIMVCKAIRGYVSALMRGYARVCEGMRGYARLCVGLRQYASEGRRRYVSEGMCGYARICM